MLHPWEKVEDYRMAMMWAWKTDAQKFPGGRESELAIML